MQVFYFILLHFASMLLGFGCISLSLLYMLPFKLTDAVACLISSFDPSLDLYYMLQIIMLFACVGR